MKKTADLLNSMRISLLMPSRNRAYNYWEKNLNDIYSTANHPGLVEVVTALDGDDPQKEDYFNIGKKFPNQHILIGNETKTGYSKCGFLWEQCAAASTGKILTLWNDDMFMQTKGWDDILFNALADKKLIGTANIIGDNYSFCCVSVSRKIYEILGEFTFNYNGSIDRCYEALNKHYNCQIKMPFTVRHIHDINFPERDAFYNECARNWNQKMLEWDTLGLVSANKLINAFKMNRPFISYLVTCKNTGFELQFLLERLYKYGQDNECIILDDYSDNPDTLQILNNISDNNFFKVHKHKLDGNYSEHKNYGKSLCQGEYIFQIDDDELPSETLLESLKELIELNNDVDLFWIPRINDFKGVNPDNAKQWGWRLTQYEDRLIVNWPDPQGRLFKNVPYIEWKRRLHEKVEGAKTYVHLPSVYELSLHHNKTIEKQIQTNIKYNKMFTEEENKGFKV